MPRTGWVLDRVGVPSLALLFEPMHAVANEGERVVIDDLREIIPALGRHERSRLVVEAHVVRDGEDPPPPQEVEEPGGRGLLAGPELGQVRGGAERRQAGVACLLELEIGQGPLELPLGDPELLGPGIRDKVDVLLVPVVLRDPDARRAFLGLEAGL